MHRRDIIAGMGAAALTAGSASAQEKPSWMSPLLPGGTREGATLEALPGKQQLIRLSARPPNYEAPIEVRAQRRSNLGQIACRLAGHFAVYCV